MVRYAVFLRAVNVAGTGKLPMADLRALCTALGFSEVSTYIASGNVLLTHDGPASAVAEKVERGLADHFGKPVGVLVRTGPQLTDILSRNPFPDAPGNRVLVTLLPPGETATAEARHQTDEVIVPSGSELFVHYGDGMGASRLVLPASRIGTARNLNTIRAVADRLDAP